MDGPDHDLSTRPPRRLRHLHGDGLAADAAAWPMPSTPPAPSPPSELWPGPAEREEPQDDDWLPAA